MIREKLKIKNVEIKVIKWMRVWNDNKEEKSGERERDDICYNCESSHKGKQNCCDCKTKKSIVFH